MWSIWQWLDEWRRTILISRLSVNRIVICKYCNCELNSENRAQNRKCCKPCRSKENIKWAQENSDARKKYINSWVRKIGRVKEYPCEVCQKLCFKKYAKAFCSDECRFMSYVKVTDECWLWHGTKNRGGYGKLCFRGNKTDLAHRVSYKLFKGPIEESKFICHSCDITSCVKPAHLWPGNAQENMLDMVERGRQHSKLSVLDVYKIRQLVEVYGVKQEKIVEQFKVTSGTISSIVHRRIWKHI